ncbi:DUF4282 domain-containing protein [Isoalcanivorax beigongshangi]|uniref:DUF4282 domain-containing protein n=1 Tax=Isoalcanivorax beigongshangi TaxID=3238810 RepID=A0ABV4AHR1_9GAMM
MVTPTPPSQPRERLRRALIWVVQYWRELFNFRFDRYMIIQVLPGVYGLALAAIAIALTYLSVEAFFHSTWRGMFYFFFAAPLTFLVLASTLRALLEFYMVMFRIAEHLSELAGMRDTVDRLSGISDSVDEMANLARRIPFWRALTGFNNERRRGRKERSNGDDEG